MRLNYRLCAGVVFASLISMPALADEGLYLRLGAGANHGDDDVFSDVDFELGYVGTAAVGYNWFFPDLLADLRVELEGSYRYNDTDTLSGFSLDGDATVYGAMVNAYADIRTTLPVVPYLGVGFGAARLDYEDDGAGLVPPIDDHDTKFAYQVMGGVNYNLAEDLALGLEYRFFEAERYDLVDTVGNDIRPEYNSHSFMLTVTVGF